MKKEFNNVEVPYLNEQHIESQKKLMVTGTPISLTFFERIFLITTAIRDGKKEMPGLSKEKYWDSSFIEREEVRYNEFCERTWGINQILIQQEFVKVETLINFIKYSEAQIIEKKQELAKLVSEGKNHSNTRKRGEEDLDAEIVSARRSREAEKKIIPVRQAIESLKNTIEGHYSSLFETLNRVIQLGNECHFICARMKEHVKLRITTYWDYLLKHHKNKKELPVDLELVFACDAEERYKELHQELIKIYHTNQISYTQFLEITIEEDKNE